MNRLFIALPIDEGIIKNLHPVYTTMSQYNDVLKVVEPSLYHLTLKFIGECEGNVARTIESEFASLHFTIPPLPYSVKGIGMFPNSKNPSVIWTAIETDNKLLSQIVAHIQNFAKKYGIKEEDRPFVPHLTLARIRKGRKLTETIHKRLQTFSSQEFGQATFNRVILFSSKLTPQGPVYTELKEINLL